MDFIFLGHNIPTEIYSREAMKSSSRHPQFSPQQPRHDLFLLREYQDSGNGLRGLESTNMKTAEEKQKIIRIAEACGWHSIQESGRLDGQLVGRHPDIPRSLMIDRKGIEIPNYLDSLKAMWDVEEIAFFQDGTPASRWETYDNHLHQMCFGFGRAHATARQRAEAFLKTIQTS